MSEHDDAQRLINELDRIEKRIRDEHAGRPGWRDAFVAFVVAFNTGPVAEFVASRKRLRALEQERDRLMSQGPCA